MQIARPALRRPPARPRPLAGLSAVPASSPPAVPDAANPYAGGPAGFLQWLLATHPDAWAKLQAARPDLIQAAAAIYQATPAVLAAAGHAGAMAPGEISFNAEPVLAGLGDLTSLFNSISDVGSGIMDTLSNLGSSATDILQQYNAYREAANPATAKPVITSVPASVPSVNQALGLGGTTGTLLLFALLGGGAWLLMRPKGARR